VEWLADELESFASAALYVAPITLVLAVAGAVVFLPEIVVVLGVVIAVGTILAALYLELLS
jgi:hypothetical protein